MAYQPSHSATVHHIEELLRNYRRHFSFYTCQLYRIMLMSQIIYIGTYFETVSTVCSVLALSILFFIDFVFAWVSQISHQ